MYKVIQLSGPQGAGKTTLARAITAKARDLGFDKVFTIKFAEPLYDQHEYLLNKMSRETGIERDLKDGTLLQRLGDHWREKYGKNIFVTILNKRIQEITQRCHDERVLIIVDDLRYRNEFDGVNTSLYVRLDASEDVRQFRAENWRPNTAHSSENDLRDYVMDKKFEFHFWTDQDVCTPSAMSETIGKQLYTKPWIEVKNG